MCMGAVHEKVILTMNLSLHSKQPFLRFKLFLYFRAWVLLQHVFVCHFVRVDGGQELLFSFLHVNPGKGTLVTRLGGDCLHPLCHLASIMEAFFDLAS